MSECPTVSELRKAAHELAGLPMIKGKCPEEQVVGCPICTLADRLEEAERRDDNIWDVADEYKKRAEKAERDLETERNRHRAWTDAFGETQLTHVMARVEKAEREVERLKEALEFAVGAIADAIGLEDGLDAAAGEAVLKKIEAVHPGSSPR